MTRGGEEWSEKEEVWELIGETSNASQVICYPRGFHKGVTSSMQGEAGAGAVQGKGLFRKQTCIASLQPGVMPLSDPRDARCVFLALLDPCSRADK